MDDSQIPEEKKVLKKQNTGYFWPITLIFLGFLLLLNNLQILPWEVWRSLAQFWPVILILLGLHLLMGKGKVATIIVFSIGFLIIALVITSYNPKLGQNFFEQFPALNLEQFRLPLTR